MYHYNLWYHYDIRYILFIYVIIDVIPFVCFLDKCQANSAEDEYVESVVCKDTDLNENEMKVFEVDESKVLLVKQKGEISALGTKCTHYGAPLDKGVLGEGRIRCQWHGACFNIKTGDIEDFPGM